MPLAQQVASGPPIRLENDIQGTCYAMYLAGDLIFLQYNIALRFHRQITLGFHLNCEVGCSSNAVSVDVIVTQHMHGRPYNRRRLAAIEACQCSGRVLLPGARTTPKQRCLLHLHKLLRT